MDLFGGEREEEVEKGVEEDVVIKERRSKGKELSERDIERVGHDNELEKGCEKGGEEERGIIIAGKNREETNGEEESHERMVGEVSFGVEGEDLLSSVLDNCVVILLFYFVNCL